MRKLKANERLVFAEESPYPAKDGSAIPVFKIVPAAEADPARVYQLKENERLILAGHVLSDRKRAEERFAALKAGREMPPREEGTPLYVVTDQEGFDLNEEEQKALNADLSKHIYDMFSLHMRKMRVAERQGKNQE
jgi:hypothetical protein